MNVRFSVALLAVALSALAADCSDANERREKATFELVPEGVEVVSVSSCGGWEVMAGGCSVLELEATWAADEARLSAYQATAEAAGWTVTVVPAVAGRKNPMLNVAREDYSGTIRLAVAICPRNLAPEKQEGCADDIYVEDR